ncbi:MAG: SGNH/GDSL hydrolase family protein [Clostridia bacterium]|nr:SGNH/GDSL hydrolase family protein [Clostridia bacterium]
MLSNTLYKLTAQKKLKIAYFGGSILDGACASDMEKTSCRALTTKWFRESYPDAVIEENNACIGGTGTGFGMFRIGKDVLAGKPDLIFIEYATNDWEDDYDKILMQTESVLRKIRRELPFCDVIMVMATDDDITDVTDSGVEYESRTAHAAASHHYKVPVVDPGAATYAWLLRNKAEKEALSPDKQHPNDLGYSVMADSLTKWLGDMFKKASHPAELRAHAMPKQLCDKVFDRADMEYCENNENVTFTGFEFKAPTRKERVGKYLDSTRGGDEIVFNFEGTVFGIYWIGGFASTDVLVSIDGEDEKQYATWDNYLRGFQRLRAAIIRDDLEDGPHVAKVRVLPCDESHVGIGGFFVCR